MRQLRLLVNRLRGRPTVLTVDLLGRPARLSITSRRELRRVHSVAAEGALLGRVLGHVEPGDTIYDIGANIGIVSLAIAVHRPDTRLQFHAFEPEPTNFDRLEANIRVNGLVGRVVPHQLALGADDGEAELFVRPGAGEGRHSMASAEGSKSSIRIAVATMATFAGSHEPPDLVKVDVEGAEGQVLSGMDGLLADHRPREIFLEIHPRGGGDRMPDGRTIRDWLVERRYALAWEQRQRSRIQQHYR